MYPTSRLLASLASRHHPWRRMGPWAKRAFSQLQPDGELADRCNLNIISSPYPPIVDGPYPPLAEVITAGWRAHGGYLDDQVAILDGTTGLTRTFDDYHEATSNLAATLHYDMDVDEHSTVAIYSPNHVDYVPVTLAVALCGAKLTPINPLYTSHELETILERSRSSVLIAHVSKLDVALETARRCTKYLKHVIVLTDFGEPLPTGTTSFDEIRTTSHTQRFHQTIQVVHKNVDAHPFLLPYSSGTTGLPKGVCLSHRNLVANLLQLAEVEDIAFPSTHKLISPLPFFHIYAFTVSMLYCAWKGQQIITLSGRFDLETYCRLVEEHKPQRTHLVPPILVGLAKSPIIEKYDLSSLTTIVSAAAPVGSNTEEAVKRRIPGVEVKQGWGMSELSPIGTMSSDYNAKPGSVGQLVPSTFAKIVAPDGSSLGPNESGELVIKGPQVMMGYLDDPDKTSECLSPGGWLRTGDVAHYDEDGFFFITDRLKELIKVKGYQVAPAELEALLLTHDHISDVAVVPVPDEEAGELPRAYVVLKDNDDAKRTCSMDIYQWIKDRVAPYKRLNGGVVLTDTIPKSASGKILRRLLRDQVHQELLQQQQQQQKQ